MKKIKKRHSLQRILHIGWGYYPWRAGGLIEYTEDLIQYQKKNGLEVAYFFSGRQFPFGKNCYLRLWKHNDVPYYEIINSPIVHAGDRGTINPAFTIDEPISEALFRQVLQGFQPDLVHVHELAGLPSSLINIIKDEFHLPVVMTLADYFLLCPTLKLLDYDRTICSRKLVGHQCVQCCSRAPRDSSGLIAQSIFYPFKSGVLFRFAPRRLLGFLSRLIGSAKQSDNNFHYDEVALGNEYQRRRETNLRRLKRIDRLIARSRAVESLYKEYLNFETNITTVNPVLRHFESIEYERKESISLPIRFVTLNGLVSTAKGGELLLDAIEILRQKGYEKKFIVYAYGGLGTYIRTRIRRHPNLRYYGPYQPKELNRILSGMHIGLVPSIWEEVYGYVGPEMLLKGLPLIGSMKGGIVEYTVDGVSGWLNQSVTAEELSTIMSNVIDHPEEILLMHRKIREFIRQFNYSVHYNKLERIYLDVI